MRKLMVNAWAGISILLLGCLLCGIPYLLIAFQQLHIDFRLWGEFARIMFILFSCLAIMLLLAILFNNQDHEKKIID